MSGLQPGADNQIHRAQERFKLPDGARQILLIRHGSSIGPTMETLTFGEVTITNPPLSADGLVQAEALARHLADEPLSRIFVTPLQRTQQTAAPLLAKLGLEPTVIAELREVHLGDWEHSFHEHAAAGNPLVGRMFAEESWEVIPRAEPIAEFAGRLKSGIETIASQIAANTTVAAFTHAAVIAEICCQATRSTPFAFMAPENASITRLIVLGNGSWRLRSFNEVSHL